MVWMAVHYCFVVWFEQNLKYTHAVVFHYGLRDVFHLRFLIPS
jgi:hypothetical protein